MSPFGGKADEVHLVALNEPLGGIISQNDAGEVSRALFFDQQAGPQWQPTMPREELVQGCRSRRCSGPAIQG